MTIKEYNPKLIIKAGKKMMSKYIDRFLEITKKIEDRENIEQNERLKRFFEKFHLINRNYLDKGTFEKARESIPSIIEVIKRTLEFLESEISRLRNKRARLPYENVILGEMQKIQTKNEMLIKEYITNFK